MKVDQTTIEPYETVAQVLWKRARTTPDRRAFVFLDDRGFEQEERSYAALSRRARAIAEVLLAHARPGDRAALMFEPGMAFLDAFFGCLYAQIIAVPMMPPKRNLDRGPTSAILLDCAPRLILTTASSLASVRQRLEAVGFDEIPVCVAVDEISDAVDTASPQGPVPQTEAIEIAFLQYTSGSTSLPKGVEVTNRNLCANARMIAAWMQQDEDSHFVGWAPLYHDQGLIGNVLQPLYLGSSAALMAPNSFLQRPQLWIEAIDKYRAHTSGGPDYAFSVVADRLDPAAYSKLDLSCWKIAFNGAEPIRAGVLDRFARALAPLGFRAEALYPCYGLAEATLFVTGASAGRGAVTQIFDRGGAEARRLVPTRDGQKLVSCGSAAPGIDLVIVDTTTKARLTDGQIGEVWVAGASVARGYWRKSSETVETFGAFTTDGAGPFMRTGDLGALVDGELYICGRLKDLIIIRGRNLYPQDIESTARGAHPAVSQGSAAAVAITSDESEKILVAVEVNRTARRSCDPDEISVAIRRKVREQHDVTIDRLVLLGPGGVPKTTSGKVRRNAVAQAFHAGTLPVWQGQGQDMEGGSPLAQDK